MSVANKFASRVLVRSIEQRSDNEVGIVIKEDYLLHPDNPKERYLRDRLGPLGIVVEAGERFGTTPFIPLVLTRRDSPLTAEEVMRTLEIDEEVELSLVVGSED